MQYLFTRTINVLQLRTLHIVLNAVLSLLAVCTLKHHLHAQTPLFSPESMTNRRLGLFSDATAVAWNPALLGTRPTSELLLAGALRQDFMPARQFGLFAKLSHVAFGYVLNTDSALASGEFYLGTGIDVIDDRLWLGASARVVNPGNISRIALESVRWNASIVARPLQGLFLSISATTMGADEFRNQRVAGTTTFQHLRDSPNDIYWKAGISYSPVQFATLFVHYSNAPTTSALGAPVPTPPNALGIDIGASVGVFNDAVVVSGNYNIASEMLRVGMEANIGALGLGLFRAFPPEGTNARQTAIVRLTSDAVRSSAWLLGSRTDDDGCLTPVDTSLQSPDVLIQNLQRTNPQFASTLLQISPQPQHLYNTIRARYYQPPVQNTSIKGDTIDILSTRGHTLQVLHLDNSRFPETGVVLKVFDAEGRSVYGLGQNDFAVKDPRARIVSVQRADSTSNTPVDVVFVIDCSGSMTNKIRETRENAKHFAEELRRRGADYRIGVILYGLSVVDILEPTDKFERFEAFIAKAKANQPDEYLPDALRELAAMKFRPTAQRIGIVITDEVSYTNFQEQIEPEIIEKLWEKRIKLNKIVKTCDNNGSATAYLTLGREYNIKERFDKILDDIGRDITNTYTIVYRQTEQKITYIKGTVRTKSGAAVPSRIAFTDHAGNALRHLETARSSGAFVSPIAEGKQYSMNVHPLDSSRYESLTKHIDLAKTRQGDTVTVDVVLERIAEPIVLLCSVADSAGKPVQADIYLSEIGENTTGGNGNGGNSFSAQNSTSEQMYETPLEAHYQKVYGAGKRLSALVVPVQRSEYLDITEEIDFRSAQQGDTVRRRFIVRSMPKDIRIVGKVSVMQPEPRGVDNAVVTATETVTNGKIAETRTNANGDFTLTVPKGKSIGLSVQVPEYYPHQSSVQSPKQDTAQERITDIALIWKNVIVTGTVEAAKTGSPVPLALVVTQKDSAETIIAQTTTAPDGSYKMIVPKDVPLRLTAQSAEHFFASETAEFHKHDTAIAVKNFRLPEALTLRINFPTNEYSNPMPFVLDSNGLPSSVRWQDELNRVANNLLLFKNFLGVITITGHTDDVSSDEYNLQLGKNRAEFVIAELIKRGIPKDRLRSESKGEQELLLRRRNESLETFRARCRRVELVKTR